MDQLLPVSQAHYLLYGLPFKRRPRSLLNVSRKSGHFFSVLDTSNSWILLAVDQILGSCVLHLSPNGLANQSVPSQT